MRNERTMRRVAAILLCSLTAIAAVAAGAGKDGEKIELGRRYFDPLNGFSLRAPTGTQQQRKPSPSLLVSWVKRDAKTGAIAWVLSVQRAIEAKKQIDLKSYSKELVAKLRREGKFRVGKAVLSPVAGKGAIHLRGQFVGQVKLWRRQVWILAEPGRFLIITVSGQVSDSKNLDAICDAVLKTLRLIDSKKALERRKAAIERGRKLLAALGDKKLSAAVERRARWYSFRLKDKHVGYMKVAEKAARRGGDKGVEITSWVVFELPKAKPRLLKRVLFARADRSVEVWSEHLRAGKSVPGLQRIEKGSVRRGVIDCSVLAGKRRRAWKKALPPALAKMYLPRATGEMLPRLVDLKKPAAYAFAQYNTETNRFDTRTFTVIGRERIKVGDRQVEAIRATDQPADDREPVSVWLDKKGRLIRMETESLLVMEPATLDAVLRRFPDARRTLRTMDDFAKGR